MSPTVGVLQAVAAHGLPGSSRRWPTEPLDDEPWRLLLAEARRGRLGGLLASAVAAGDLPATDPQVQEAADLHFAESCRSLLLESEALTLLARLESEGVRAKVLKGAAVAHLDYSDPDLRQFLDVDLLVRSSDIDRVTAVLAALGHRRHNVEPRPGFDRRFGKGATFTSTSGYEIDLHRTFVMGPFGLRLRLEDLWEREQVFWLGGQQVRALDAECRFLHACYHCALGDRPPRLVPQRDLAEMLLHGRLDVSRVHGLMTAWQAQPVVARAVTLAWTTLGLTQDTELSTWARRYVPTERERKDLEVYVDPGSSTYAAKSVAAIAALPSLRDKAALAYALGLARPGFVPEDDTRHRLTAWRHAIGSAGRRWSRRPVPTAASDPADRVRVLWLTKGLGRGGAEKLLVTGAAHLDAERYEVEVAYLLPWKDALVPDLLERGLQVHCLEQKGPLDLTWIPRLSRLLQRRRYDVVHTHMPLPAVAARLLARRSAIVHTEHNVWQRYRRPTYLANALTYRRNDAVLYVSDAVAGSVPSRWLPHAPRTGEVLLHGVEHEALEGGAAARSEARDALGLPQDAFVVGTVGNLTPKKDQASLLRAFAALRVRHQDARLVVVGNGPLQEELEQQAADLGLSGAAHFLGSRGDVPALLPAFDVFCLSSLHEGLPIALLEAMASGVPTVCSDVGGIGEVVRHEVDGLLVPPSNPERLSAALARLAEDAPLRQRLAQAAVERSQLFDIGTAVARIEAVYDAVLARR